MFDLRPVGYIIGLLTAFLGVTMLIPMLVDYFNGNGNWTVFLESAVITSLIGGLVALTTSNGVRGHLSLQQTFFLTTGVWLVLPVFGAIPFVLGATEARFVDAFFEAMSGFTTTGATVFTQLDELPHGLLLWRGLMQWFGGIGIIVVAMVFLPELRIGGMQIFRSEGFDTFGKILPRATEIAARISVIYFSLTAICAFTYMGFGMNGFDAVVHAMTTIATGGFANYDASFGGFDPAIEYVGAFFMLAAALPFVRYVQLLNGATTPLLTDSQVRTFLIVVLMLIGVVAIWLVQAQDAPIETAIRRSVFNVSSLLTGTGYASADYMLWGPFPIVILFFAGLIGGCAGSTSCSVKIFRYQLLVASIRAQIQRIYSPSGIFTARYAGRRVSEDALNSVMAFFVLFVVTLGILSILLSMTGLDLITSVSGAAAALANIGPGLGDIIGPAGNYSSLNDWAKWLLAAGMLVGRLELLAVYVMFTASFWRG